jgi:outer membrane protein
MKLRFVVLGLLAAPTIAGAQVPAPVPGPAAPAPAPASTPTPAPTPTGVAPPATDNPPPDAPQWLPGVVDVTAAETATPGKLTLTMARAVEIAAKTQPSLRIARADVEAAEGRVDSTRIAERPVINLGAQISTSSRAGGACNTTLTTQCGGFFTGTYGTGFSANASWRIYDFGLTAANVRAARANADASIAGVTVTALDVRRDVEITYLAALADQRLAVVAGATVKSEAAHLDQARRFVAAQAKDPIEVAQAQARYANAKSALSTAQSNEAVALANLRAAIGWIDPSRAPAVDPTWPTPADEQPPDLATLVKAARQYRPEIVQYDKQIAAADANVTAAHAERRPVLSANASALWGPSEANWSPQPSWSATLALTWALYDGGRAHADQRVANANMTSAIASRDALLVSLTSALESSRAQIVANRANVDASNEAVTAAQAQLKLAEARYTQGLGSQIELADAQTAVTTASGNLITAQLNLADAWATLRRAIGQAPAGN